MSDIAKSLQQTLDEILDRSERVADHLPDADPQLTEAEMDEELRAYGYDPDALALEIRAFVNGCVERYRHRWTPSGKRRCPTCSGGGKSLRADGSWGTCPRCKGEGEVKD